MPSLPRAAAALLLASGLFACSASAQDSEAAIEELRSELDARAAAEAELAERLDALEAQIDRVANDRSASQRLNDLSEQLSSLGETVAGLDERFVAEAEAREAVSEEATAAAADLRSTLADLQGRIDQLQGETDELRTLYQTLRERLDRMQQG